MLRRPWVGSSRLYLIASLVLAISAGVVFRSYARGLANASERTGPTVPVVVAAKPVTRGQPINADQVRAVSWPAALAPPGSFQDTEKATGRVALADLAPGEAVTETRLARVRAGPVASLIPEGLRAFAVPTSLPAGMVMPGDRVDVLATYGQGQSEARTETVLDAVEVLLALGAGQGRDGGLSSLDRGLDASAGQGRSVTLVLLVTSEQQERLAFASSFANLEVTIEPV